MKVSSILTAAWAGVASALDVNLDSKLPDQITNESPHAFILNIQNKESEPINVTSVTFSLRTPGKDWRKTYGNFTENLVFEVGRNALYPLTYTRVFSVPSKKYDVLAVIEATNGQETESFASEVQTIKFDDPEISWLYWKVWYSVAIILAFVVLMVGWVTQVSEPSMMDQYVWQYVDKLTGANKKPAKKEIRRSPTPSDPTEWIPNKYRPKSD